MTLKMIGNSSNCNKLKMESNIEFKNLYDDAML